MQIALLDGDIIAHRCAASCLPNKNKLETEPLDLALLRTDELTHRILGDTAAERYRIFLSGATNYRYSVYKDYKANRRDIPRPEWLDPCREFLVREWGAEVTDGYEADDGIGIAFTNDSVICSIDKDFNQIPGWHYNFVTQAFFEVDEREAALHFWMAMLQGDRSDNIRGITGVGFKKAYAALSALSTEEMERTVLRYYEGRESEYLVNYHLLRILRSEDEYHDILKTINAGVFEETKSTAASTESSEEVVGDISNIDGEGHPFD